MSTMARKNSSGGGKAKETAGSRGRASSGSMSCPSCASKIQGDARFCQHCGKSLDNAGWLTPQTLTVLASAVIVLVALGLLFSSVIDIDRLSPTSQKVATAPRTAASGQPPDLATMSPREAADRLFNRVMMADEQGNTAEVEQFAPMAVSAYEMLESLDTDALFHVSLIHAAAGEMGMARDYTERLKAVVPNHLLAALMEIRLAEAENNERAAASAAQRFHDNYDEEISTDRPEYLHHQASIERFRMSKGKGEAGSN